MKKLYVNFALLVFFFHIFQPAINAQNPVIVLDSFSTGFYQATDIANAGDSRLFVTEQPGMIRILTADGVLMSTPFLDISGRVDTSHNERGLLGLTFHPDYKNNGYLYVNYTAKPDGDTRISRFTRMASDSNKADPNSELIILTQDQPFGNHNAGALHFGPDGYLYFGFGDGGAAGDQLEVAQDGSSLLGKMIRIDVNGTQPYSIPSSNPFVGNAGILDEIWAIGVRNPFRFSFDKMTGDMWIADVGQNEWEEINFEPAGSPGGNNWGWDCYEGNHPFELTGCAAIANYDFPVFEYPNNTTFGCAILGGYVYRGDDYPNLQGHYLFTDLCTGRMWTLFPDGAGGWDTTDQGKMTDNSFTTFGQAMDGELYVAERTGNIYRIRTTVGASTKDLEDFGYQLLTPFPNPFSETTLIKYELAKQQELQLYVVDMLGRKVVTLEQEKKQQGKHQVKWNGTGSNGNRLDPGNYFIVMEADGMSISKKVMIIR